MTNTTTTSFKWKSRIITILAFLFTWIAGNVTVEQIASGLPEEYKYLATFIFAMIGFFATQLSEEKRVHVAEELIISGEDEL